MSPAERSVRARIAAHHRWAKTDPTAASEAARLRIENRFLREADPEGILAPAERARRAEHLKRAYFSGLALKSARARRGNQ